MMIKKLWKEHKFIFIFILFIIAISLLITIRGIHLNDFFWHVKAGEFMSVNKRILTSDPFSWILKGTYWMSHEWLYEIILYQIYNIFGGFGPFIYCFFMFLIFMFVLFFTNKKEFLKNKYFSIFYLFLAMILLMWTLTPRPQLFTHIFLAFTLYILFDLWKHKDSKKIYFLPLIACLWGNIHGGSSNLVYLLPIVFTIVGLFQFQFEKIEAKRIEKKQIQKFFLGTLLSFLALFINPHTYKIVLYPYQNMKDTFMMATIAEWQPTTPNQLFHYVFYFFLLLVIAVLMFSKKRIRLIDFIVLGVFVFLGLKSIRFWSFFYIATTFIIFRYIPKGKHEKHILPLMIILSICFVFLWISVIHTQNNVIYTNYEESLDKKVIEILKEEQPKRLYNSYDFGGELIYNEIPVFIDGRADLYSKHNYQDSYHLSLLLKDYQKMIDQYDFDYFLVQEEQPIAYYLKNSDKYKAIYINKEKDFILYSKQEKTI